MNIFIITLIIFVTIYIFLNWFSRTSSKKISKGIRSSIIVISIILALTMAFAGRYLFSVPFLMMILPLIQTKAGVSILQLVRIWGLLRVLKNYGRFNFNNLGKNLNTQNISLEEAYRILNLDPKKKYKKDQILTSYKKIMKKIHPDVSPELTRLASIVNEAKDLIIKDIS